MPPVVPSMSSITSASPLRKHKHWLGYYHLCHLHVVTRHSRNATSQPPPDKKSATEKKGTLESIGLLLDLVFRSGQPQALPKDALMQKKVFISCSLASWKSKEVGRRYKSAAPNGKGGVFCSQGRTTKDRRANRAASSLFFLKRSFFSRNATAILGARAQRRDSVFLKNCAAEKNGP